MPVTPTFDAVLPANAANVDKVAFRSWMQSIEELVNAGVGGGGGGSTNLGYAAAAGGGTVTSDTGTDATLPLADGTNAGLMAPAQHTKLAGIETGATADMTGAEIVAAIDAQLGSVLWQSGGDNDVSEHANLAAFPGTGEAGVIYVALDTLKLYRWTGSAYAEVSAGSGGGGSATPSAPQGRLTLTSGTPVTTADVTAATTVYYSPYEGRYAPFYDGSAWAMADVGGELSQALSDATKSPAATSANNNYDLFLWNDGGTYRCTRGPAWSSATARGTGAGTTELERVQGRLVNKVAITNGPAAQRGTYVGTIRTTAANQCEDSLTKRLVWNTYNRRARPLFLGISTDSWTYSTNTWRQVQASATYQFEVVNGVDEDSVEASYIGVVTNSTATARNVRVSVGLDSTTTPNNGKTVFTSSSTTSSLAAQQQAHFRGLVGLGYHYLAAMEKGADADTQTWIGDGGATEAQCGMFGSCFA